MVSTRSHSTRAAQKAGVGNVAQKLNASKPAAAIPAKKAGAKKAVAKKAARKVIAPDNSLSENDDVMELDDVDVDVAEKVVVENDPKKLGMFCLIFRLLMLGSNLQCRKPPA